MLMNEKFLLLDWVSDSYVLLQYCELILFQLVRTNVW